MNSELINACYKNNLEQVKLLLLDHRTDPNLRESRGWTALRWPSIRGHTGVIRLLLDHGADPNLQDNDGWTALMWPSVYNNIDLVRLLLDHGADPNLQNDDGETALMWASSWGHTDIVKLIENVSWNRKMQPLIDLDIFPQGLIQEHLLVPVL
jgi:ankyrin repeat protein